MGQLSAPIVIYDRSWRAPFRSYDSRTLELRLVVANHKSVADICRRSRQLLSQPRGAPLGPRCACPVKIVSNGTWPNGGRRRPSPTAPFQVLERLGGQTDLHAGKPPDVRVLTAISRRTSRQARRSFMQKWASIRCRNGAVADDEMGLRGLQIRARMI